LKKTDWLAFVGIPHRRILIFILYTKLGQCQSIHRNIGKVHLSWSGFQGVAQQVGQGHLEQMLIHLGVVQASKILLDMGKSAARSAGAQIGRQIMRGILDSIFGRK